VRAHRGGGKEAGRGEGEVEKKEREREKEKERVGRIKWVARVGMVEMDEGVGRVGRETIGRKAE
jgi:hypothetical protein